MRKIEHIGIAVKDLATSIPLFEKLLNSQCYKQEFVAGEEVNTAFFMIGETKLELIEGVGANRTVRSFIEKRGEGVHHIAFDVADIIEETRRLKAEGFTPLNDTPRDGADNKLVNFFHPKTSGGVLVELCMEKTQSPEETAKEVERKI
jgi:methylmalonyl-CoA/ethylmalonyl-CoA epimerase